MKCTNKFIFLISLILMASLLTACSESASIRMPFSTFREEATDTVFKYHTEKTVDGFASDLCVFTENNLENFELVNSNGGLLVSLKDNNVLFSQNAFEKFYPASITKVMTCYIVLKYADLEDTITCTSSVSNIKVPDAVVLGLKKGDTMTVDQALHLALLSSYNDVAVALAEHISGSIDDFADLMNEEAKALGATSTHFTNPHGLPDDDHYTTVYDLYLIFNEAIKNPTFLEIIGMKEYRTTYKNSKGKDVTATSINTNQFLRGNYELPDDVVLLGGKTGTTEAAGNCLMLLVNDKYSNPYISVILGADTKENLYHQMSDLLSQLTN